MDWTHVREGFPTLSQKTYLNSCSLGALHVSAREAVVRFLDLWEEHGASAWYKIWLGEVQAAREAFAKLIGARTEEIAILPNVSSALSALASSDLRGGNVVSAAMDFPTIPYQWMRRGGFEVRLAPTADEVTTPLTAYDGLVDDHTRWIATSHVFYTSGAIQDVPSIVALAKRHGARTLLDAYQATGQLPTDVRALGVDAYVSGGLKWLLGGPGLAYLYVRRELHEELSPQATGWFAHADQFTFDTTNFRPHADARRFEAGTPAVAAVYAGRAGLDLIAKLGTHAIRERTRQLVRMTFDGLADAGYELATPAKDDERAGIVSVRVGDPPGIVRRLAQQGIVVDHRPGRIRVSPYFYNTEQEVHTFVEALRRADPTNR